jgi:ElaB/YqjD/DUF883 family membrane-anchored ribosome-binding protein
MGAEQDPVVSNPLKEDTRSSGEIKSDIRRTRGRLDDTLETLNERLSPRSLINDVLSWFEGRGADQTGVKSGDSLKRGYRSVIRQIKDNPMPALLIGAGISWMILGAENDESSHLENQASYGGGDPYGPQSSGAGERKHFPHEQSDERDIASSVKEKTGQAEEAFSGATEAVTEKMSDIGSGIQARARSAASAISEVTRRGRHAGREGTQHLQQGYAYAGDRFQEAVEEYPFAVAVGFLGVGLLTGLLLPRTPQEDKLLGESSDRLVEQVKQTGKETLDKAKAVAQRVTDGAINEAKQQGIMPEDAADKFSEIAGKVGAVANKAKQEAVRAAEEGQLKPTGGTENPRS